MSEPKSLLCVLSEIDRLLDSAEVRARMSGKNEFWQRDKEFVATARDCLLSSEPERIRWLFDELRNASHGFGSYCADLRSVDVLLDTLHSELREYRMITSRRAML